MRISFLLFICSVSLCFAQESWISEEILVLNDCDYMKSYYSPEYPLSESLLKEIISFIKE